MFRGWFLSQLQVVLDFDLGSNIPGIPMRGRSFFPLALSPACTSPSSLGLILLTSPLVTGLLGWQPPIFGRRSFYSFPFLLHVKGKDNSRARVCLCER